MIDQNLYISENSVKPEFLKRFFAENKKYFKRKICAISRERESNCLSLENKSFQNILRAAIRYYYDEEQYNSHFGGDLTAIFSTFNNIFRYPIIDRHVCATVADLISSENFIKNPSSGVSLFYGHMHELRWAFRSITNSLTNKWSLLDIKKKEKWIRRDIRLCERLVKKGTILFRGRAGYLDKKYIMVEGEKWFLNGKVSYSSKKDMGKPSYGKTPDGRCNKKGISLFYLASDIETVVAELKPKLGTYISIGCFKSERDIKVVDIANLDYYDFGRNDNLIEKYIYLKNMQKLFMMPINDQNQREYQKSQFITEIIKDSGFGGLIYNSSVAIGKNYGFFSDKKFSFIENSTKLIKIKGIQYSMRGIKNKLIKDPLTDIYTELKEKEVPCNSHFFSS